MTARRALLAAAVLVVAAVAAWWLWPGTSGNTVPRMTAGPYLVQLTVADGTPHTGDNTVELDITDQQGAPATPDEVSVEPAMPQMGHAVPPGIAETITPGRYRATVNLPMPGQWEIAVHLSGPQGAGSATLSVRAN
ncbi:FixH family protein [Nocardia crassostreae]|uniref:FixH family protein n=1 Tax=Nocardia crassostreae TaxID=53428 RepID=UPI0008322D91|nr:FixH family protein [Nocardia crassostreae]